MRALTLYLAYFVLLSGLAVFCYLRPTFQPDVAVYANAALQRRGVTAEESHKVVFEALRAKFGAPVDNCPTPFWKSMLANPKYFAEQIPFFSVKPLFVWLGGFLGLWLGLINGFLAVSAISVFLLGAVVLVWVREPWVAALFMLNISVLAIGRLGTPDALSTALVLAGLYCFHQSRLSYGMPLLLVSILARPDNFVLMLVAMVALFLTKRISLPIAALWLLAGSAFVFFTHHTSGSYSWQVLMVNSHYPIANPADVSIKYGLRDYLFDLAIGLRSLPSSTQLFIWIAAGLAAFRLIRESWTRWLLVVTAVAVFLRFLAFPISQDRYFVWSYLVSGVCLAQVCLALSSAQGLEGESAKRFSAGPVRGERS